MTGCDAAEERVRKWADAEKKDDRVKSHLAKYYKKNGRHRSLGRVRTKVPSTSDLSTRANSGSSRLSWRGHWERTDMCEHCGCRGVEPIAELMDEHLDLLELGGTVRRCLADDNRTGALAALAELGRQLGRHVRREEAGVFTALKNQGDYVDEVLALEVEHTDFDQELAALDADAPDFAMRLEELLADLSEHVDKENLGIFPVAVVTLGATGWEIVGRAHEHPHDHVA